MKYNIMVACPDPVHYNGDVVAGVVYSNNKEEAAEIVCDLEAMQANEGHINPKYIAEPFWLEEAMY